MTKALHLLVEGFQLGTPFIAQHIRGAVKRRGVLQRGQSTGVDEINISAENLGIVQGQFSPIWRHHRHEASIAGDTYTTKKVKRHPAATPKAGLPARRERGFWVRRLPSAALYSRRRFSA